MTLERAILNVGGTELGEEEAGNNQVIGGCRAVGAETKGRFRCASTLKEREAQGTGTRGALAVCPLKPQTWIKMVVH